MRRIQSSIRPLFPLLMLFTSPLPAHQGYVGEVSCDYISGWAWDGTDTPINVVIYDGSTQIAVVPANRFRVDLLAAGIGNGYHAFSIETPSSLRNSLSHTIHVQYQGSSTDLIGSPVTSDTWTALGCRKSVLVEIFRFGRWFAILGFVVFALLAAGRYLARLGS